MKTIALTLVASAAALATLVSLPASPASAATAAPTATSASTAPAAATSTVTQKATGSPLQGIAGTINTNDGVGLVFSGGDWTHADNVTKPTNIPNGGGTTYSLSMNNYYGDGAYGTVKAQIYDKGVLTPFWVTMYSSVYWYPYDKGSCTIYRGDPDLGGTALDFSPYQCSADAVTHSDPWQITFTVSKTPAISVTDKADQARLLAEACNGSDPKNNCFYIPRSVTTVLDGEKAYGNAVNNPTKDDVHSTVTAERKYTESDTIGVTYNNTLTLWEIWEMSVELNYEHTWTQTRDFKQSVDMDVKPGTMEYFTIAAALDHITGDFLVRVDGKVYSILNSEVTMPNNDKAAVITPHIVPAVGSSVGQITSPAAK